MSKKDDMKAIAFIFAMPVVTLLIFVGIGYFVGGERTNSVSSSSKYLEDSHSISDGEDDEYAWLLPAFVTGKLMQSELSSKAQTTDWAKGREYMIKFTLPDKRFISKAYNEVRVYYPRTLKAGEIGVITTVIKSTGGNFYRGYYQFTAEDDLSLVYGASDPEIVSGGEFYAQDDCMMLGFYTSAMEHYQKRSGHVGRTGAWGTIKVEFETTEDFLSGRKEAAYAE